MGKKESNLSFFYLILQVARFFDTKKTEIPNKTRARAFNSNPLNGKKSKASGAPNSPKIKEPHVGQPALNIPAAMPANPIVLLKENLYASKLTYNPNNSEIAADAKIVITAYKNPFISIKILKL